MITVHVFLPSGFHTYDGGKRICRCGQVENSRLHDVPETPEVAKEIDKRRLGESE
ncbi:MAG TPA: hypothetical protein VF174_09000 [Micromonosporaceae bacterium]